MKRISLEVLARRCLSEAKGGQLTVLAGAGVSMLPPSFLPSGYELKRMAVEDLCDHPQFRQFKSKIISAPAFARLVPEVLFQRLYDRYDSRLLPFFDLLKERRHNVAHEFLARLAGRLNTPILTTNFDDLIEASGGSRIFHLHGDLADPGQMVVRLHQVGRGLPDSIATSAGNLIGGRVVCVLGYSGNDEDIRQLLKDYQPAEILWLVRNERDPALLNLSRFFQKFSISVARGSLHNFVDLATKLHRWKHLHGAHGHRPAFASRTWHLALTEHDRCAGLAEALFEVRQYRACAEVAKMGATWCPRGQRLSWFHVEAADAFRTIADTRNAMKQAQRAEKVSKKYGDYWDRAAALNAVGLVYLERERSDPKQAGVYLRRSLKTLMLKKRSCWDEKIIGFAARVYNNLGLVEMERRAERAARSAFAKSIRLKRKIGDLPGEGTTSASMAILNAQHGRMIAAARWRRKALLLIDRYDQKYRAAYLYRRFGVALCDRGNIRQGLPYLTKALTAYQEIRSDRLGTKLTVSAITEYTRKMASG